MMYSAQAILPRFKLTETYWLGKWVFFYSLYIQYIPLSWGPGRILCEEPDSAIFFAKSLSRAWKARLSHLLRWVSELCHCESDSAVIRWVHVLYIVIWGRLSKSLLRLWRRLSCFDAESPCCVHTGVGIRLSKPLLSHGSSSSANPCWDGGGRSSYQRLSKPLLSWWKETWLAVTEPCELDSEQSLCWVK